MPEPILSVRGLTTEIRHPRGNLQVVRSVDFDLHPGETLGIVGESGSGKTMTVLSILGLLPERTVRVVAGEVNFEGRDLTNLPKSELRKIRGGAIGMIFQDPMTSLNPVMPVGWQIAEAITSHQPNLDRDAVRQRAVDLLELVGVSTPRQRAKEFPHQFSGGMRQRAMIAIAIANDPKILIADEPTTALDVTIQAQVLDALRLAQRETGASMLLITHDLGVIAEMADRVIVMYGGRVVEEGPVRGTFHHPRHPYTAGLLRSLPAVEGRTGTLEHIPGNPPSASTVPSGCAFHPRCSLKRERDVCVIDVPELRLLGSQSVACHFAEETERR